MLSVAMIARAVLRESSENRDWRPGSEAWEAGLLGEAMSARAFPIENLVNRGRSPG